MALRIYGPKLRRGPLNTNTRIDHLQLCFGWCSSQADQLNHRRLGIEFVEQILPSDGGGLCDVIHISSNAPTSEEVQDETL